MSAHRARNGGPQSTADATEAAAAAAAAAIVDELESTGARRGESIIASVRGGFRGIVDGLPDAMEATGSAASASINALGALPEPNARLVAAFSAGLGIGLYLAGAPRVVTAAATAPAIVTFVLAAAEVSDGARPRERQSGSTTGG